MEETRPNKLSVTWAFLETARSASLDFVQEMDEAKLGDIPKGEAVAMVAFSLASIPVIYSYLAIESFINYQLHCLRRQSRSRQREIDNSGNTPIIIVERLNEFYKKFGVEDDFKKLKDRDEIRELSRRIKTVCRYLAIQPIHEVDSKLWERFQSLLKDSRHFLVHPYPDQDIFNGYSMKSPLARIRPLPLESFGISTFKGSTSLLRGSVRISFSASRASALHPIRSGFVKSVNPYSGQMN